ncbi:MAG: hypothetical protein ACTSWH_04345, partial [Promethearchaeota archaeon]
MPVKKENKKDKKVANLKHVSEIFQIMTDYSSHPEAYLDIETGDVIYLDYGTSDDSQFFFDEEDEWEEEESEEQKELKARIEKGRGSRYLEIPSIDSWESYNFMKLFIEN